MRATSTYHTVSIVIPMPAIIHFVSLDMDGSNTLDNTASMNTAILGLRNAMKNPSTNPSRFPSECCISFSSLRIISIPRYNRNNPPRICISVNKFGLLSIIATNPKTTDTA